MEDEDLKKSERRRVAASWGKRRKGKATYAAERRGVENAITVHGRQTRKKGRRVCEEWRKGSKTGTQIQVRKGIKGERQSSRSEGSLPSSKSVKGSRE